MALSAHDKFLLQAALGDGATRDAIVTELESIGASQISAGAVGTTQLDTAAVTAAKIGTAAVTNAKMAVDLVKYTDTTITTAQVLALNTTPITLVAAPGAGLVTIVDSVYATLTYNSATYAANAAGILLKYTDGSGTSVAATLTQAFVQSAASAMQTVGAAVTALTPVANAAIVAHAGSANPTTGDSDIKIRVYYRVVPNPLS